MLGAVAVGNQSFYAALGGKKPIVSGVALLPVDAMQKNEFALFGTNDSVLGPWGTFAKTNLHAKTAAVIYPQVPGIDVGAKVEKTSLEAAGITTKLVGFDPNSTDLTGPLTAAGAQTADIVVPQSNAAGCVNVAKTLQQLGVSGSKIVSNPLCLSGEVAAGLGGDLAPWVYGIASTLAGDKSDKAAVPYNKAMAKLGQTKLARRRVGDRLLGPDPHDREDDEQDRRREAHVGEVHRPRSGRSRARRRSALRASSAASTRRSLRRATTRRSSSSTRARASSSASAGWLRPPRQLHAPGLAARRSGRGAGSHTGPAPSFGRSQGMDWNQLLLFAILGLGAGALIAGIAHRHRPDLSRLGDHQPRDRRRRDARRLLATGRSRPASTAGTRRRRRAGHHVPRLLWRSAC